MDDVLLFVFSLIFMGILLAPLSKKIGAPILLLVLVGAMLVGEDGPGGVDFDNFEAAYTLGSLALAVILFAGGLETRFSDLRGAKFPAAILATFGVVVTAAIVGVTASFILDVPIVYGLLLGAVVGSTDAAATFLLIRQNDIKLPGRLENTLIFESGINDPMAIFLTVVMTGLVASETVISGSDVIDYVPFFIHQLGFGATVGVLGGYALAWLTDRITLPTGLTPPFVLSAGLIVYFGTALLEGSGFLAIYLCGLVFSHRVKMPIERILHFAEGLQWLSQIGLFMMLGLLVTPHALLDNLWSAIAIAVVLMFVARPIAVFVSISYLGFQPKELIYLSWVGLRGAVPIFLAIFPVISPGPVQVGFFNVVFVVVVLSLVLQGWSVAASARWLKLNEE